MNFTPLQQLLTGVGLTLVLVIIGVTVAARSHKGHISGVAATLACAGIGLFIIGVGISGGGPTMAKWMAAQVGL